AWDLTNLSELETYKVCETGKVGDLAQAVRSKDTSVVRAVRWLPHKHHILFSGNDNGVVAVWDTRSNRTALSWKTLSKGNCIRAMRLTSDGAHLVMVLYSGTVILCDAVTMEQLGTYEFHDRRRWSEKMSNALDHFAICDEGSAIRVALPVGDDIEWIRFSKLYSAGADRNVLCWAPESERNRLHLEAETAKANALSSDWSDDD
ncbi:hypothetical protein OSTOST_18185, partial [Ostertagia ostertagi]